MNIAKGVETASLTNSFRFWAMNGLKLKRTVSTDPDSQTLIRELDADLRVRNGALMDVYDAYNIIDEIKTVVTVYLDELPVGCACFKRYDTDTAEIKRMFVLPVARGNGISTAILTELEVWAKSLGFRCAVLETGSSQFEALGLYRKQGYSCIPNYIPYTNLPDSICFRKTF